MKKEARHNFHALYALLLVAAFLAGCGGNQTATPSPSQRTTVHPPSTATREATASPTPAPTPTPVPPLAVEGIEVAADPEVLQVDTTDPHSLLGLCLLNPDYVDRDKYNQVFHAVQNLEPELDTSSFKYSRLRMNNLIFTLDTNFLLFYLKDSKVSKNGKKATFTYTGDRAHILHDTETFHARLGHLIHDVAPEDYNDLQKLAALYDAVCRMSNYTANIDDVKTWSPYSIVTRGEGICSGYAMLMRYLLNQSGVEAECVSNEPHAWNIVKINGKWYHSDTTWGAGNAGDTVNTLRTMLMDDAARVTSLKDGGLMSGGFTMNGNVVNIVPPPPCTDASYNTYAKTGWSYALDLEGQSVYFAGNNGIERMNLDCTGRQTILPGVYAFQMEFFNGNLYYVDSNDGYLYQAGKDAKPVQLFHDAMVSQIKLEKAKLIYQYNQDEKPVTGSIELLPEAVGVLSAPSLKTLPEASTPRGSSFCFKVRFLKQMDPATNWNNLVYLVGQDGQAIPLHFLLDTTGTLLTVRPKTCLVDEGAVSLLLSPTILSADGAQLENPCRMDVRIEASKP